ncbi:MAG TPA: S41 family peptidase [Planctomycetota bacterium]|nr:S41 family peptidase [Planctomycetota bacterium]
MPPLPALLLALALVPQDLSREDMQLDLETVAREARAQWSYLDDKREHFGVDLEGLVAAAAASLPESATRAEFDRVLRRLVAALGDGHGSVQYETPLPRPARRWPFTLIETAEGLTVARSVGEGGPAPGDLLRAADARPADELWRAAQQLAIGSTPGMRRRVALERMRQSDATALAFEFEGADGARRTLDLATLEAGDPRVDPPAEGAWSFDELAPGVVRLRIASFAMPQWRAWLDADQTQRDAMQVEVKAAVDTLFVGLQALAPRALVLDLRGNAGGTDTLGIHFAERLLPEPFVYFRLSALREGQWSEPHGYTYGEAEDLPRVVVPTIALIDAGCFSTTDNFLRALDTLHPDFASVGRPTGAGTGAPRQIVELPHSRARITLCTQRVYGPDGTLIEGRGTTPDVPVAWSPVDLREGRDPDVEAALTLLRSRDLVSE